MAESKRQKGQVIAAEKRREIARDDKKHEAYRLWVGEQKSVREIAEILDISKSTAANYVNEVSDEINDEHDEEARSVKARHLRRLFTKHDRLEKIAMDPELSVGDRIKAENAGTAVLKEISDVLGVKAPVKHANADGSNLPSSIIVEVVNGTNGTTG
jgi:DNA-binding CsgD family transcriptional regulator